MEIYLDCHRFESEAYTTRMFVYDDTILISEKVLQKMDVGRINVGSMRSKTLRIRFEISEKSNFPDNAYIEKASMYDVSKFLDDKQYDEQIYSLANYNDVDCIGLEVYFPKRWVYAYDTEIVFYENTPDSIFLTFKGCQIAEEIICCETPYKECRISLVKNISDDILKKDWRYFAVKCGLKILTIGVVGLALFLLSGTFLLTFFEDWMSRGVFYFLILGTIILPSMFVFDQIKQVYQKYKSILNTNIFYVR